MRLAGSRCVRHGGGSGLFPGKGIGASSDGIPPLLDGLGAWEEESSSELPDGCSPDVFGVVPALAAGL